jgi:AAA15 family ATPase/GTPase
MLIKFSVENFLSFKNKIEFSMIPSKFTKYANHISKNGPLNVLKRGIIYGANASGKTNFIKSLYFFKKLITSGNIDALNLNYNKFHLCDDKKTTSFEKLIVLKS